MFDLTLLGPQGGHIKYTPPAMHLRLSLQIHLGVGQRNLTFPNCKFGTGQYAFYTIKLSRFAEKSLAEIPEFHKGGFDLPGQWPRVDLT